MDPLDKPYISNRPSVVTSTTLTPELNLNFSLSDFLIFIIALAALTAFFFEEAIKNRLRK
jgi:hypothetical protein